MNAVGIIIRHVAPHVASRATRGRSRLPSDAEQPSPSPSTAAPAATTTTTATTTATTSETTSDTTSATSVQDRQAADLALATSRSMVKMCMYLQPAHQPSSELRHYCCVVLDHIRHIEPPDGDLTESILHILESLINPQPPLSLDAERRPFPRQRALVGNWDSLSHQTSQARHRFTNTWLDIEHVTQLRPWHEIVDSFKKWDEDVLAKYPRDAQYFIAYQSPLIDNPEPVDAGWNRSPPATSRPAPSPDLISEAEYTPATFYDDETPPDYNAWKNHYQNVYKRFIDQYLHGSPKTPVKIAVLDTGVDESHSTFSQTGQIKGKYNWTHDLDQSVLDLEGHGTFTAGLLADFAPDAELFISKIADKKLRPPGVIAQAIYLAVDDWKVDIISMSFGWPTNEGYEDLAVALKYAYHKNVLMFAAASNNGANTDRSYPARDPHVICVNSTDSYGNKSAFSPTAVVYDANIATIGEAVQSAWPVALCDRSTNPNFVKYKSGTSYATAILAGIAAFLLQYARLHLEEKVAGLMKNKYKMRNLLLKIAERLRNPKAETTINMWL